MTEEGIQTEDIRERCQKREDRREINMGHKQKGRNIGKRVGSEDIKGKRQGTTTEVKTRRGRDREGDGDRERDGDRGRDGGIVESEKSREKTLCVRGLHNFKNE